MRGSAVSTALVLAGCAAASPTPPPSSHADPRPPTPLPAPRPATSVGAPKTVDTVTEVMPAPSKRSPFDCPDEPPAPAPEPSPSRIHDRIGGFYEEVVRDYLDAHGEDEAPVRKLSEEQADRAMCASLGARGYEIFGAIQAGREDLLRGRTDCVKSAEQGLSIGRFAWRFSRLSTGKLLATRNARLGWPHSPMAFDVSITNEERPGVVLTIVTEPAWRCPSDPEDFCGYVENDASGQSEVRCYGEGRAVCKSEGVTSQVYVLDLATERWLKFGEFLRRPAPVISVTETEVTVRVGECTRSAKRPF